jgi:hypothetical protein
MSDGSLQLRNNFVKTCFSEVKCYKSMAENGIICNKLYFINGNFTTILTNKWNKVENTAIHLRVVKINQ